MTIYKTDELTGDLLNHAVALALGYKYHEFGDGIEPEYTTGYKGDCYLKCNWNPIGNWYQCAAFLDQFKFDINQLAFVEYADWKTFICRCFVNSVFGDEIEL